MKTFVALAIFAICILLLGIGIYFRSQIIQTIKQYSLQKKVVVGHSGSTPTVPGSQLKYRVIGASSLSFLVEIKFENSYYNYNYTVDASDNLEGFLYLAPPPAEMNVQIRVTVISETGKRSQPFVFTNKQWWDGVSASTQEFAMEHIFEF